MKYYISAVLAMLMWSSSFIATKITYQSFSPILLCLIRFAISTLLLFVYRLFQKNRTHVEKKDRKNIILSAILGISIYYVLENIGLSYTSASMTSLIEAAYPALTVLVGIFIYHEKTNKRILCGIAISIIGVVILTGFSNSESGNMLGNILLLADGILWGFYNYLVQRIPDRYDSITVTFYQMLYGTIGLVPLLFLETPVCVNVTPAVIAAVLYLAAGCSVAALLLYNYGLKGLSASHASALMNVMPIFGILLSALILHETITLNQIIGGIIIMFGVFISTSKEKS